MRRPPTILARPDWWTAIFSGILTVTAVWALWYARYQIEENRQESEKQLEQSHKENQIQHLLELVSEFDRDPMAAYRRELAQKRLRKEEDPYEMYRELDFFETVDVLVERDYLNEKDVWNQFRWWVFNLNADDSVKKGIAYEHRNDPNEYAGFLSLVDRLKRIDKEQHGKDSDPTPQDIMEFWREESQVVSAGK